MHHFKHGSLHTQLLVTVRGHPLQGCPWVNQDEEMELLHPSRLLKALLLIFVFALEPLSVASASNESAVQRLTRLEQLERGSFAEGTTEKEREDLVVSTYERLFPYDNSVLGSMPLEDLQASFKAAYLASFYGIKQRDIEQMEGYFAALDARHALQPNDYLNMHNVYTEARMFGRANKIRAGHPELKLEDAPRLANRPGHEDGQPGELLIGDDGTSLQYQAVNLRGKRLVVIGHPLCHFSAAAIREISKRDDLAAKFKDALWLAPPGTRLNIAQMQNWNKTYPATPIAFIDQRSDWPMFDAWATPTFYFLTDGKVVAKVQGWPPQGGAAALDEAFDKWNESKAK